MSTEIQLTDVFNIFVNRERELSRLNDLVGSSGQKNRIQILKAGIDCGLTSALRQVIKDGYRERNLIYFNARDSRPAALFEHAVVSILEKGEEFAHEVLVPLARPDKKKMLTRLVTTGLKAIPFAGRPASGFFDLATDWLTSKPDTGEYNSKVKSLFDALCKTGNTVIVADHFQTATEHHITQLANVLYTSDGVSLVIGQNTPDRTLARQTVDEKWSMFSTSVTEFPSPELELGYKIIEFLNKTHDVHISAKLSEKIRHGLRHFLDGVLDAIAQRQPNGFELKQLHKDILCLLRSAGEPAAYPIVFDVLVENNLFISDSVLFDQEISFLCQLGLTVLQRGIGSSTFLMLSRRAEEIADQHLANTNLRLYYSNCLYRSVDRAVAESRVRPENVALLMYKLSSLVDEHRSRYWSIATVRSCITASNFFEADQVLTQIKLSLSQTREEDILTVVSACIATKRYEDGLNQLRSIERQTIRIKILESILLYRCLHLEQALVEMEGLWQTGVKGNDACLLATFFVGLCIDLDKVETHRSRIDEWSTVFQKCRSYGYFLNMVAATLPPAEALEVCEQSLPYFAKRKDRFGRGGALANIGVHCIKLTQYQQSIKHSDKAHSILVAFGIQHVHLVANNLGCANLMIGNYEESRIWLRRCLTLAQTRTVRVHALTNLAAVSACMGSSDAALAALNSAADESAKNPIFDVKRALIHNAAIICGMLNLPIPQRLLSTANTLDVSPESMDEVRHSAQMTATQHGILECLRKYYRPPTNQYWYPNPMDLFEEKRLSPEANVQNRAYHRRVSS